MTWRGQEPVELPLQTSVAKPAPGDISGRHNSL
jgi:hypothetical protein